MTEGQIIEEGLILDWDEKGIFVRRKGKVEWELPWKAVFGTMAYNGVNMVLFGVKIVSAAFSAQKKDGMDFVTAWEEEEKTKDG